MCLWASEMLTVCVNMCFPTCSRSINSVQCRAAALLDHTKYFAIEISSGWCVLRCSLPTVLKLCSVLCPSCVQAVRRSSFVLSCVLCVVCCVCRVVFQVLPGSRIPADGTLLVGSSYINEAMITGESQPVWKDKGDVLIGGTINTGGGGGRGGMGGGEGGSQCACVGQVLVTPSQPSTLWPHHSAAL
jgi:hypothetical protein